MKKQKHSAVIIKIKKDTKTNLFSYAIVLHEKEVLLSRSNYTQKTNCIKGVLSALDCLRIKEGQLDRFQIKKDVNNKYFLQGYSRNGKDIFTSKEVFVKKQDALDLEDKIRTFINKKDYEVIDYTKKRLYLIDL